MLDERDLQAIAQLIDSKLQESEQRTSQLIDSKLQESEQRTAQLIDSKLKESEQRTMGAIKESEQRTMQGAAALMESYFEPKFQLLAEGIQSLQETQIPSGLKIWRKRSRSCTPSFVNTAAKSRS